MKVSELYEHVGNHDRAKAARAKPATDINLVQWINKRLSEERKALDEGLRERA